MIENYNKAKVLGRRPTDKEYYHAKKYDVMTFSDEKVLILKRKSQQDPVIQVVPSSKYYQTILDAHVATGHGRRDKIIYDLKDKYMVPVFAINIFLQLCKTCLSKKSFPKTGIVVKPLITDDFNRRGQVDLVDFQSSPDGEYKWMLQYQDHLTKFCFLRPLKSKEAKEVAIEILKIFLEVGCPNILQSDSGREFTASILKEIVSLWPACKIVNGRPRYPQSQGSVERSNQDVKNMIRAWMVDNNSNQWSIGCYFAQFQKNSSYHSTIGRTPFKALFGDDPRCGLTSTYLSKNIISQLEMEEDLETFLKSVNDNEHKTVNDDGNITSDKENLCKTLDIATESIITTDNISETEQVKVLVVDSESTGANTNNTWQDLDNIANGIETPQKIVESDTLLCHICNNESSGAHTCIKCQRITHVICGEPTENNDEGYGSQLICKLCTNEINILRERKDSHLNLKRAAEKMTAHSSKKFKNIDVGATVLVEVPRVDRGPLDSKNVVGKVIENKNELYKVGTSFGIINDWLPRNAVLSTPGEILNETLPETKLPLRKISAMSSTFGGQGIKQCNCKKYSKGQCLSNKCNCKKANILCNSRCHKSLTCTNK
ncbi:hypothetical protein PYW08_006037 [Mythimna loreyi]|uniref:Uncharacterized protein n=1 Tax=Mythimna loreyi TaxID=667449 RepID=A0ACC2QMH6_9NEOP|nr:hypothetical protein PYW08_006037 [Mythimna loreyi]